MAWLADLTREIDEGVRTSGPQEQPKDPSPIKDIRSQETRSLRARGGVLCQGCRAKHFSLKSAV